MPTFPTQSVNGDVDEMAEFRTPNSGSMDLVESDSEMKLLFKAKGRSRSAFAVEPNADHQAAVIDWLKARAEAREGYTEYMAAHSKPQHNPDVVRHWEFAVTFFRPVQKGQFWCLQLSLFHLIYYLVFCLPCHIAKPSHQSAKLRYRNCPWPGYYIYPECCQGCTDCSKSL